MWVGDLSRQEAILGMDYMVPAGIRLDLAGGTFCLPDEVRIQLSGRRPLYSGKAQSVKLDRYLQLGIGESAELPIRLRGSKHDKLWVTRGDRWVPTVIKGPGRVRYLQIANNGEKELGLRQSLQVGMWLAGVPRIQGYVSVGSRRYMEWQNLALQATTETGSEEVELPEIPPGPLVERPEYPTPHTILRRPHPAQVRQVESGSKGTENGQDGSTSDPPDRTAEGYIAETTGILLPQASTTAHALDLRLKELREYVPNLDPAAGGLPNPDPSDEDSVGRGAPTIPTTVLTECRIDTVLGDAALRRVSILSPSPQVRSQDLECGRVKRVVEDPPESDPMSAADGEGIELRTPRVASAPVQEAQAPAPNRASAPDPDEARAECAPDLDPSVDPSVEDPPKPDHGSATQGLTTGTQGCEGALDPADVGQAVHPVVTSGGNHEETGGGSADSTDGATGRDMDPVERQVADGEMGQGGDPDGGKRKKSGPTSDPTARPDPTTTGNPRYNDSEADEQVCYHVSGDRHAEDVEAEMAVLPEVTPATEEVTIEDIQVGDPDVNTVEEIGQLRRRIWRRRHLLIGKGNALPPAARGVVCDIDVGDAKPIAQRVRKVASQYHEKLSDLVKGLLGAKIIKTSTSPWASPIVVILKKNDYGLVSSLTRLMIYPMPLINDLLEDLDKVLRYCSLDMASGFWVVTMTDRARAISAFITPFGLYEWNRMHFGLKNAPQIYQRMLDNALYGFTRIPQLEGGLGSGSGSKVTCGIGSKPLDLDLKAGESEEPGKPSVLGRRSYIDDILVTAGSWDYLCNRVDALLDACDKWNLSISVVTIFWGKSKVECLGHRVSHAGLEANPKDLSALTDLPFPGSLRSKQSFLGSLNYYSRFLEDYAIYAAVLYELREVDFAAMSKPDNQKRIHASVAAAEH